MPGISQSEPAAKLSKEQYRNWKLQKDLAREQEVQRAKAQREEDIIAGRIPLNQLTGRELFHYHPEAFDGY